MTTHTDKPLVIRKFTNCLGNVCFGLVTEWTEAGAYVISDHFAIKPGVELPVRYSHIVNDPDPAASPDGAQTEYLPIGAVVSWSDERLVEIHELMRSGRFSQWWDENRATVAAALHLGGRDE